MRLGQIGVQCCDSSIFPIKSLFDERQKYPKWQLLSGKFELTGVLLGHRYKGQYDIIDVSEHRKLITPVSLGICDIPIIRKLYVLGQTTIKT